MKLFTTTTCAPCKVLKQMLRDEGLDSMVEMVDDVDQFAPGVRAVPTLQTEEDQYIIGMQYILPYLRNLKELEA